MEDELPTERCPHCGSEQMKTWVWSSSEQRVCRNSNCPVDSWNPKISSGVEDRSD